MALKKVNTLSILVLLIMTIFKELEMMEQKIKSLINNTAGMLQINAIKLALFQQFAAEAHKVYYF